MKKACFSFFLLLTTYLFSSIDPDAQIIVDESSHHINQIVSPQTGSLSLSSNDYTIQAIEPIHITRSYSSFDGLNYDGGWSFFPHLVLSLYPANSPNQIIATEPSGIVLEYTQDPNEKKKFIPSISDKTVAIRNTSQRILSAQTHFKNNKLSFRSEKKEPPYVDIALGNGGKRIYQKAKHCTMNKIDFLLKKEVLPNQNVILYKYDSSDRVIEIQTWNPKEDKLYASLKFNYFGKKEKDHDFDLITSDHPNTTSFHYRFKKEEQKSKEKFFYLDHVFGKTGLEEKYHYNPGYNKYDPSDISDRIKINKSKAPQIEKIFLPNNKELLVDYYKPGNNKNIDESFIWEAKDLRCEKVLSISEKVGENNTLIPTYHFIYRMGKNKDGALDRDGLCRVNDILKNETDFYFSDRLRMDKISFKYKKKDQLIDHHLQKYYWGKDDERTDLQYEIFFDPKHESSIARSFLYDKRGNVTEETLFGNLSTSLKGKIYLLDEKPLLDSLEKYSKKYTYSEDGFNLPLSKEEDNGKRILYTYKPNTNLITSKLICDKNKILRRYFYQYNEDNILIRTIIDDGSFNDPDKLDSVQIRKIVEIIPKQKNPAINFPEVIKEKYFDLLEKKEKLLKKKILHYSDQALVTKEDIYDENDQFCYSLFYKFNDAKKLLEKINPLGQKSSYKYDDNNNLIFSKEAGSAITKQFIYDEANHLITKIELDTEGTKRCYHCTYNAKHNKTSETDYQNNTTKYIYDSFGKLIEKHLPPSANENDKLRDSITYSEYDAIGNEISQITSRGKIEKEYNAYNKHTKITHPDGSEEIFLYNLDGTLKEAIDQIGTITRYTYDVFGRETSKTTLSPAKQVLSIETKEYNGFELTKHVDAEGNSYHYFYDQAGRKIAEEFHHNNLIERKEYQYDHLGKLYSTKMCNLENSLFIITIKDLLDRTIEEREEDLDHKPLSKVIYEYDPCGNKNKITRFIDGKESITRIEYDDYKRPTLEIDPLGYQIQTYYFDHHLNHHGQEVLQKISYDKMGIQTIETYNTQNKVVSTEKYNQAKILIAQEEMFYDSSQNLTRQISSIIFPDQSIKQVETRWIYDNMNRLIELIEASGTLEQKQTSYTYTPKGQIFQTTKPDGIILENTYDPLGNLISLESSNQSIRYLYQYNKLGHLTESIDLNTAKKTTRKLDGRGRILKEILDNCFFIAYQYDRIGRPIKYTLFDGSSIEKVYNAKHLKKVIRKDSLGKELYCHQFLEYDLDNNLLKESLINDLGEVTYHYDLLGRKFVTQSSYLHNQILQYDPEGKIKKMQYNDFLTEYAHDELGQITEETGLFANHFSYDSLFNRLSKEDEHYSYNDLNQLKETDNLSFVYNDNGCPTSKKTPDEEITYEYDALDRLISITNPKKFKVFFTYDSFHRRTTKKAFEYYNHSWHECRRVNFLYQDQDEIGAALDSGEIYQLRILSTTDKAEIGSAIAHELPYKTCATLHDLFGNVTTLIDNKTLEAVESCRYSAFGEEIIYNNKNETIHRSLQQNPWRYSSKRTEEDTSLIYYGRRFYDPQIGRWLTPDPQGFTDILNLYTFVLNDPLLRLDLYGLQAIEATLSPDVKIPIVIPEEILIGAFGVMGTLFSFEKSNTYHLGRPELPNNKFITFINGIFNNAKDAEASATYISDLSGGYNVHYAHNATHTLGLDVFESAIGFVGVSTTPVALIAALWKTILMTNPDALILHFCHSQGAIHTYNALFMILPHEKARINICAIAPAKYIPNTLCNNIDHYASSGDLIHRIDLVGNLRSHADITILEPHPNAGFIDHSFQSETFKDSINKNILQHKNNHSALNE